MSRKFNILNELSQAKIKKNSKSDNLNDKDTNPLDLEDQSTITEDEELQRTRTVSDEYKDEFLGMAIAALKNISTDVNAILDHMDIENVRSNLTEPWVQGVIAVIENNMSAVHDFVKFTNSQDDTSITSAQKRPGLWDNIRKKKEKEGKNYRPAKPGDKDRPDPEMWKKLTK